MSHLHLPKVTFIKVVNNQDKQQRLVKIVQENFSRNKKCIIFTASFEAAKYVDDLIWRFPSDSFIPHTIADRKTNERIVITTEKANLNEADVAINLTALPLTNLSSGIKEIIELFDISSQDKETASKQKLASYKSSNHCVGDH